MINYRWTCQACDATNQPDQVNCTNCGCSSTANADEVLKYADPVGYEFVMLEREVEKKQKQLRNMSVLFLSILYPLWIVMESLSLGSVYMTLAIHVTLLIILLAGIRMLSGSTWRCVEQEPDNKVPVIVMASGFVVLILTQPLYIWLDSKEYMEVFFILPMLPMFLWLWVITRYASKRALRRHCGMKRRGEF